MQNSFLFVSIAKRLNCFLEKNCRKKVTDDLKLSAVE